MRSIRQALSAGETAASKTTGKTAQKTAKYVMKSSSFRPKSRPFYCSCGGGPVRPDRRARRPSPFPIRTRRSVGSSRSSHAGLRWERFRELETCVRKTLARSKDLLAFDCIRSVRSVRSILAGCQYERERKLRDHQPVAQARKSAAEKSAGTPLPQSALGIDASGLPGGNEAEDQAAAERDRGGERQDQTIDMDVIQARERHRT